MSLSVYAKTNGTQGALQVNGVDALVLDTGGTVSGVRGTSISGLTITQADQPTIASAGGLMSYTHGLSTTPVWADIEFVCTTADAGYAVGDIASGFTVTNGTYGTQPVIVRTSTTVSSRVMTGGAWQVPNKTTGANTAVTVGSWSWRFKVRVA
jgi:hypothetical protein